MAHSSIVHIYLGGDQYQMETLSRRLAEYYNIPVGQQGYFPPHRMVNALLVNRRDFEECLGTVRWQFLVDQLRDYLDFMQKDELIERLHEAGLKAMNEPLYLMSIGVSKPRVVLYDLTQNAQHNPYAKHTDERGNPWPLEMGMLIQHFD